MASDSESDSCPDAPDEIWTKEREEYAESPAAWLSKLFHAIRHEVHEEIKYYTAQQEEQTKAFLQAVADSQRRYGRAVESPLIFWLGIIAFIVAASAGVFGLSDGLVVGAVFIGLVVVGRVYLWTWFVRKRTNRLDMFRKRFRELLDSVNDIRWQTRPEDKAFLEKYKDGILFSSVIPYEVRERIWPDQELGHVETLYEEYRNLKHVHPWPDPNDPNSNTKLKCELCMTADRVRKNVERAISAYEATVASARQDLAAQIDKANADGTLDAKAFLDEYSKRKAFYYVPEDLADQDENLLAWLNSLCHKQRWTFEDADKVREICWTRAKGESHWLEWYEQEDRFDPLVGKLTQEMKSAAACCGLADTWDWYDTAKQRQALNEGVVKVIRRILGRHNPEAMFRELNEDPGRLLLNVWSGQNILLPGLERYGYDAKLVAKECKKATHLISKQRDKSDRERDRELHAMQAFIRAERHERG